jgi:hypothetical protein
MVREMKTLKTIAFTTAMLMGMTAGALAEDAKPGTPAKAPAVEAKKAPPAAAPAAAKMEVPKPPQEVADAAKLMVGTWKCTGKMSPGGDASKTMDVKATLTSKLDLDKWWITTTGITAGKPTFKWIEHVTYDSSAKKWFRIGGDNMGGSDTFSSTGPADGKIVWEGEGRNVQAGRTAKVRFTETMAPKEMKVLHEISMDAGKTWSTTLDGSCKK